MHDPYSLILDIKSPFKNKKGEQKILVSVWHKDPCRHGDDHSCGFFTRSWHLDKNLLYNVQKDFEYNLKHWFDDHGDPKFSTIGIMIDMYSTVGWLYFNRNKKKLNKFMNKYLYEIINTAENDTDCIGDYVSNKWNESFESRMKSLPGIILADIVRKARPWWKHPKFHIHHWRFTFPKNLHI